MNEIKKAKDEAHAENILLEVEKFATSLIEKDKLVNKAVELYPDVKQRAWRQLGVEMSVAVVDGFDRIKQMYLKASGYDFYWLVKLEQDEITIFTTNAISYLKKTVLDTAGPKNQKFFYFTSMYWDFLEYY